MLLSPTQMVMNLLWQVDEDSGTSQNSASPTEPGPDYGALWLTPTRWVLGLRKHSMLGLWGRKVVGTALKVGGGKEMHSVSPEVVFHNQP